MFLKTQLSLIFNVKRGREIRYVFHLKNPLHTLFLYDRFCFSNVLKEILKKTSRNILKPFRNMDAAYRTGNVTRKIVSLSVLDASIVPLCSSTMPFEIARPRPDPPVLAERDFSTR